MNMVQEKKMVVFLDYDGTLSPIVNDPDRAFMSDAVRVKTCLICGNVTLLQVPPICRAYMHAGSVQELSS